jgi:hypothetical protein
LKNLLIGAMVMKKPNIVKRMLSGALAGVMLASGFVFAPVSASAYDVAVQSLSSVSSSDWMSVIMDGTKLTEITMPGTHDSCARKFKTNIFTEATINAVSKCQSLNITEQLNAGVRFLDVRCEVDASTHSVKTVHGTTDCWNGDDYYYLDFLFQDLYNWLDAHPSETVLVSIRRMTAITACRISQTRFMNTSTATARISIFTAPIIFITIIGISANPSPPLAMCAANACFSTGLTSISPAKLLRA